MDLADIAGGVTQTLEPCALLVGRVRRIDHRVKKAQETSQPAGPPVPHRPR